MLDELESEQLALLFSIFLPKIVTDDFEVLLVM